MTGLPNRPTDFTAAHGEPLPNPGATLHGETPSNGNNQQCIVSDVLVIGGGFSGMYSIHRMRQLGLTVKLFEAGGDFGGTWHWNRYPGARVDSEVPFYSLSLPEIYENWEFTERYPDHQELRDYFKHVDQVLDLRKDAYFNTIVVHAKYHNEEAKWHVQTKERLHATATYLICATGSSYKRYFPQFEGLEKFTGQLIHSAAYPKAGLDVKSKRVGVLGSGATGLQIVQELAKEDCDLTAFVRTPNIAIPMRQRKLSHEEQTGNKNIYQALFNSAKRTRSGLPYPPNLANFHDTSPDERREVYEKLWERGGFSFMLCNFKEFLVDRTVNQEIYQFWLEKTRSRVQDPVKREIVAPMEQPHWLGTKRASLEQDYYEMIDRPNVTVVDLKQTPILNLEEQGVRTSEKLLELDIIIFATGYDALTGSLKDIGLIDTDGVPLSKKWEKGTYTYMGLMIPKLPNMFMVYSPQAPTSLANGPPIIEMQIDWIAEAVGKMRQQGIKSVDAQERSAEEWRATVQGISDQTLFKGTKSWYTG
jgi:cation diffusion facilitator CzcD-associated flavoprotein CzcO